MNKFGFAFAGFYSVAVAAPILPSFTFAGSIALPSLTLANATRNDCPTAWNPSVAKQSGNIHWTTFLPKHVSHMPIVVPPATLDPRMVKSPSSAMDFKLIVKEPSVEPAKNSPQ